MKFSSKAHTGRVSGPSSFTLALFALLLLLPSIFAKPTPKDNSFGTRYFLAEKRGLVQTHFRHELYEGIPTGKVGDGGPDDSDYPGDDDSRNDFTDPPGPFVFFSQIGSSTPAYQFAQSEGGIIFRPMYTVKMGRSDQWYQDFADRFSGIFAERAAGNVFFMASFDNNINACRVWSRIECPTLKANAAVTSITLVDFTNTSNRQVIWTPPSGLGDHKETDSASLATSESSCFNWVVMVMFQATQTATLMSGIDGTVNPYTPRVMCVQISIFKLEI